MIYIEPRYFVIQCPKCGRWGGKVLYKVLSAVYHCKHCNTKTKIKKKKTYGLAVNHILVDDPRLIPGIVQSKNGDDKCTK